MIKIFVVCHKPSHVLKNPLLHPIQVGAALAEKKIPGMEYDDSGEHISEKNPLYCELTAQYWAWKNIEADYYGFFHYRRYMAFHAVCPVNADGTLQGSRHRQIYYELDDIRDDLSEYCLRSDRMESVIASYDLITVLRERINTTVYRQFGEFHDSKTLDEVIRILKRKYPAYAEAADQYLKAKDIYYMNMFIMKKELYQEYATWLFDILEEYEQMEVFQQLGDKKKRLPGFLAERLFGIFYLYQRKQGVRCAEVPYLKFYNTDVESDGTGKGTSGQHIRVFRLKPTPIEIKVDMRKINRMFPAGSRRRLLLRGLFFR